MNLPDRQRLGALVLIISGIAAFAAPFLIHSPPTQGNTGGTDGDTNDNNPGGGPKKKTLQDLKDAAGACQTDNHEDGPPSLLAKILSAMRAADHSERSEHQTRTDQMVHHLAVLDHKLENPSAEKHHGACRSEMEGTIEELLTS